jgi:hypothetical protein
VPRDQKRRLTPEQYRAWVDELLDPALGYVRLDPEEDQQGRLRQKVYMARYGGQAMTSWDDLPTWRLDAAYAEMARIIRMENGEKD